jgi:glycosyltransferase involved in cell wall biosynthesis
MEIIHLILGKANPDRMNGVNRVVNELASRQRIAGVQAEVWGITANTTHNYPARNYPTRLFARKRNPFDLPAALKKAMMQKHQAVFHLHGGFVPQMYAAAKLLREYCIPYVFTPHGSYNTIAMQRSGLLKKIYFRLFEKSLLKGAMAIHSLGKSEMEGLQQVFANNKSVLIPYGYELTAQAATNPAAGDFIIGYCGRIDIYTKGLKELLEGFAAFYAMHPEARLWIIGDGPEREKLEKMAAALAVSDGVVFRGARYGEEKNNLLQQCHVFAAPSRNEGLPTAVLEAASLGIPCLVTEATNTGEYIRQFDAGVVIEQTCGRQIQQGLQNLYSRMQEPKMAAAFSNNTKRMVADTFNWERIVECFNSMYLCR